LFTSAAAKKQTFAWLNEADEERNDYLIYLKVGHSSIACDPTRALAIF
jgi:hypothetical protein